MVLPERELRASGVVSRQRVLKEEDPHTDAVNAV